MQALQKAAKEREGTTHSPDKGAPMVGDLGLEPLEVVAPTKAGSAKLALDTSETPSPAQASAILQATQSQRSMIGWLRDHRKVVYAVLVGSVLLGYGVYFYVSVYHPALLRRPFAHQTAATTASTPPLPPAALLSERSRRLPNLRTRWLRHRELQRPKPRRPREMIPLTAPREGNAKPQATCGQAGNRTLKPSCNRDSPGIPLQ